jgi:hypothetical protein
MEGAAVQPVTQEQVGEPWQIDPCMDDVLVTLGTEMFAFVDWTGVWTAATGILRQEGGGYRIEPRDADDVYQGNGTSGDDICL